MRRDVEQSAQSDAEYVDMESDLVSCIIPAFNAESFVGEAIESVLKQSYRAVELIVVDDGSTERTADVIRSYGATLTYVRRTHQGAAAAKNDGIGAAQGEFIAFLDADDLWHPDKLTRQMAGLARRSEIDLSFTQYQNFWTPDLGEEERLYQGGPLSNPVSGWSMSTLLARRGVFERFGRFEEDVTEKHQSLLWALRAAERGAIVDVMPEVLMRRRLHPGNLSRGWRIDDEFFKLLKTWRDFRRQQADALDGQ
ncbi:MAG: glycosyltransferase family A protein [Candidatus Bipolaricaulota bacterium]